ncbi:hypothetical protein CSPAE12_08798 [Colletotrichum incanum]|nr:hypothetical protein CSPAE12_08798 [Colletotrichum incanum]
MLDPGPPNRASMRLVCHFAGQRPASWDDCHVLHSALPVATCSDLWAAASAHEHHALGCDGHVTTGRRNTT